MSTPHTRLALVLVTCASLAPAQDIVVAAGGSIQSAIAAAPNGARVLVSPGTYFERIDLLGKSIEVIGVGGAGQTILDGTGGAPVVRCASGETAVTRIQGLTIRGGAAQFGAGGVAASGGATPLFEDCVIRNNVGKNGAGVAGTPILRRCAIVANVSSQAHGGGLYGAPRMSFCVVADNRCSGASGGGLYVTGGAANVTDCVFVDNAAVLANSKAGAVFVHATATATIERSLFVGNYATGGLFTSYGGAISASATTTIRDCTLVGNQLSSGTSVLGGGIYGPAVVENCIVRDNTAPQISGATSVTYSDVEGGYAGAGNFDAVAGFVDPATDDYHLTAGSPCVDAGNPLRLDPDGTRSDVGAFYARPLYVRANASSDARSNPGWPEVSLAVGGHAAMRLTTDAAHAGAPFLVCGTLSGTSPGFVVAGTPLPINYDFYTDLTLQQPNPVLVGAVGALDAAGNADVTFVLPPLPGLLPAPLSAHHVALVLGTTTLIDSVSNPEPCALLPN